MLHKWLRRSFAARDGPGSSLEPGSGNAAHSHVGPAIGEKILMEDLDGDYVGAAGMLSQVFHCFAVPTQKSLLVS